VTACEHEYHWYPAPNEDGWRCCYCEDRPGEPHGFSPQHDRDDIENKVYGILSDLDTAKIIYVSNSSHGWSIVAIIVRRCREADVYDQYSIASWILETMTESHAKYWKEIGDGVVAGNDPRERCHCGKLANCFGSSDGKRWTTCSEHYNGELPF